MICKGLNAKVAIVDNVLKFKADNGANSLDLSSGPPLSTNMMFKTDCEHHVFFLLVLLVLLPGPKSSKHGKGHVCIS